MSVIHSSQAASGVDLDLSGFGTLVEGIKSQIADDVWAWFDEHQEEVLWSVKLLGLKVYKRRMKDARWIFEALAGERPAAEDIGNAIGPDDG